MVDGGSVNMKQMQAGCVKALHNCTSVEQMADAIVSMLEAQRRSRLDEVDQIERILGIEPRTAELRSIGKKVYAQKR